MRNYMQFVRCANAVFTLLMVVLIVLFHKTILYIAGLFNNGGEWRIIGAVMALYMIIIAYHSIKVIPQSFSIIKGSLLLILSVIGFCTIGQHEIWVSELCVIGAFGGLFWIRMGTDRFLIALWPLVYMILLTSITEQLIASITPFVQHCTTQVVAALLSIIKIGSRVENHFLYVSTTRINIVKECCGINSALAMLGISIPFAFFYLRSFTARSIAIVLSVPAGLVANGIYLAVTCGYAVENYSVQQTSNLPILLFVTCGIGIFILSVFVDRLNGVSPQFRRVARYYS